MKKILVCIDGSAYGQVACSYAVWLAKRLDAKILFLYVSELWQYETPLIADFGGTLGAQPYLDLTNQLKEVENAKANAIKEYVKKEFESQGLSSNFSFYHKTGILVDSIEELKEEEHIDFILLGKRGENANFAKGHLGSNMERVVRSSKEPCFIVNRKFIEPKKLLIAYDGSDSASRALEWVILTKTFKACEIHIVTVAKQGEEADATRTLFEAESKFKGSDVAPICQVLSGTPGDALEKYVNENEITGLLMGAYGHSRIRQLIIGSTTTELIRRCLVPVVVFR